MVIDLILKAGISRGIRASLSLRKCANDIQVD
jgi:hypothetical protein